MIQGIDLSKWNANVNWPVAKAAGIVFAFMKATEGLTFIDSTFNNRWVGCAANGVIRGAYHFLHVGNPVEQAHDFFNQVGMLSPGDLPPVMDWESYSGGVASPEDALTFLETVEKLFGMTPIVYGGASHLGDAATSEFAKYPLWVANYGVRAPHVPRAWSKWTFWQYTDRQRVAGVGHPGSMSCDGNLFNGSLDDLKALGKVVGVADVPAKAAPKKSKA